MFRIFERYFVKELADFVASEKQKSFEEGMKDGRSVRGYLMGTQHEQQRIIKLVEGREIAQSYSYEAQNDMSDLEVEAWNKALQAIKTEIIK